MASLWIVTISDGLRCVCFGWKSLPEMFFQKCGCLVGPENRNFRKSISIDLKKYPLTTEMNFRSYFHFKWIPQREREREKRWSHALVQSDDCWRTPSSSSTIICTSRTGLINCSIAPIALRRLISRAPVRRSHAPDCTGLVDCSTAPIAPRRSISPSTHRSLSLCDFDFCCCCGGVLVVVAFDCQSLLPWVELSCEKFVGK